MKSILCFEQNKIAHINSKGNQTLFKKRQPTILLGDYSNESDKLIQKTPYSYKSNEKIKIQYRTETAQWKLMHCEIMFFSPSSLF